MFAALHARLGVLHERGFRRLLAGTAISQFGDGIYAVAAMWLAYSLTNSTAIAGIAGFLTGIPGVTRVLVGPIVDDSPLRRVLVASELVQGAFVLVVPAYFLIVGESVVVVLATMFVVSLVGQFASPAQTATLPRVVDDDDLVRANSLASVVSRATEAGSRLLAGALIATTSALAAYVVDTATFLVAATLFLGLSIPGETSADAPEREDEVDDVDAADDIEADDAESDDAEADDAEADDEADSSGSVFGDGGFAGYLADLRAGVAVVTGSRIGPVVVASLFANLLYGVSAAVLPAYADGLSDAAAYGTLLAALSVGRVLGSVAAPTLEDRPFAWTAIGGLSVAGVAWLAGVFAGGVLATSVLFALSRIPIGAYNVSAQAVLQTGVPDDHLGRATATIGTAAAVVTPLGMLAGGAAGEVVGATLVLYGSGVGTLLAAAYWLGTPTLRRFGPPRGVENGEYALQS